MIKRVSVLPTSLPPRGLNRVQAAEYIGVSPTKFDELVSDYIISQGVIERLDDKQLAFRERATRLVTFCASGVLTVGRATTIARDTIISYLRRKDFIAEYTVDIQDPAEKEKSIKEFYVLLSRTGFDVKGH